MKPLWRSVSAFYFTQRSNRIFSSSSRENIEMPRFLERVNAFMLSRDSDTPLLKFYLGSSECDDVHVNPWLVAAAQRRVEFLELDFNLRRATYFPSPILSCNTLVVLKLSSVCLSLNSSSVDFPCLKVLDLCYVDVYKYEDLAELLLGSPNLKDLKLVYVSIYNSVDVEKFKPLPKLVKAHIRSSNFPLEIVNNVKFLYTREIEHQSLMTEFQNLTHFRFDVLFPGLKVLDLIQLFPKLQVLEFSTYQLEDELFSESEEGYPPNVPICISSRLKTCSFTISNWSKGVIRFARYVLENASHLRTMRIRNHAEQAEVHFGEEGYSNEMFEELWSCPRCFPTCQLVYWNS